MRPGHTTPDPGHNKSAFLTGAVVRLRQCVFSAKVDTAPSRRRCQGSVVSNFSMSARRGYSPSQSLGMKGTSRPVRSQRHRNAGISPNQARQWRSGTCRRIVRPPAIRSKFCQSCFRCWCTSRTLCRRLLVVTPAPSFPHLLVRSTNSSSDHSRSVTPAAIAGVIRSDRWMRTKFM